MISNGFSLVFSVAAIVAVLVGPYILIMQLRLHWRQPVVNLGLCHLLCSLASLLAAFALAGFITASVGAPPLSCAKITCDRGGVPCSPYTLQASLTGAYDLVLDPVVAQLNNKTFSLGSAQSHSADSQVVCHDYNYIAYSPNVTMEFGQQYSSNVPLLDTFGHDYGTSCYYLFTTVRFPGSYGSTTSVRSAQSSWRTLFKPNPLTMWCSADKAAVGPGFIPLNTETAYRLLDLPSGGTYYDQSILFSFDALSRRQTEENPHNFSSTLLDPVAATTNCKWGAIPWGYVTFKPNATEDVWACIHRAGLGAESQRISKSKVSNNTACDFKGQGICPAHCLAYPKFHELARGDYIAGANLVEILGPASNPFRGDGTLDYSFKEDLVAADARRPHCKGHSCHAGSPDSKAASTSYNKSLKYALELGGTRSMTCAGGLPFPWGTEPRECAMGARPDYRRTESPLWRAVLYASLRYQCSSLEGGVLCDYGVSPPLAVDASGQYLTRKAVADQRDWVVFTDINVTSVSIEAAVASMLGLVLLSNLASLFYLARPAKPQLKAPTR